MKTGDRVKVEFEGEVINDTSKGSTYVKTDDGYSNWIGTKYCTPIDEPVKVGDQITYGNKISTVIALDGNYLWVFRDGIHYTIYNNPYNYKIIRKVN